MKHSSHKAWATINNLTGKIIISPIPHLMNSNVVILCLMKNGIFKREFQEFTRNAGSQRKMERNSPSADQDLCNECSTNDVMAAVKILKADKVPRLDILHPAFSLRLDEKCFELLWILVWKTRKVWKV